MKLSIREIEQALGVKASGKRGVVYHVGIDSRQILVAKRTLFFALKGGRVDGHTFLPELYKKGVRNFVVQKKPTDKKYDKANFIVVKNVQVALQKLATYYRSTLSAKVIGITGSNGKTIVKEWLAILLQTLGPIAKSPKSYNSQIGVPLSIFQIKSSDKYAILEAGISTTREMAKLQKMILPEIGILTNIGSAHDEGFENRKEKAKEKLVLFKKAQKIIYCSDQHWARKNMLPEQAQKLNWSTKKRGYIHGVQYQIRDQKTSIRLVYQKEVYTFKVAFSDEASLENIMHCIAVCLYLDMSLAQIQVGLDQLYSVNMRLQMLAGENQCTLINDAYTADIESLHAGLDFQHRQQLGKHKTVILSDFLQTGRGSQKLYKQIAELLLQYKVDKVIGVGKEVITLDQYLGSEITRSFYEDTSAFLSHHSSENHINEIILVKGARRFRFENIIDRLVERQHAAVLQVDLSAILHNVKYFQGKLKKGVKLLTMIKASGYGSGSVQTATLLEKYKVDYFGVAYPDEGIKLRKKGIRKPILVLNCPASSFSALLEHQLEPEIYSVEQLQALIDFLQKGQSIQIHLKIETGMNRLGFVEQDWKVLIALLRKAKGIVQVKSIMTHLAASDLVEEDGFTKDQIKRFNKAYRHISNGLGIKPDKHVLNTAGILRFPQYQYDMVRLGLGLYGVDLTSSTDTMLREVLTFKASVSQIKHLSPGDTVGYNRRGRIKRPKTIAIINVGYADGLLRKAGNGRFKMWINGKLAPTVGNICMDMCMIDISKIPNVKVNDEVIIFGKSHSVSHLCKTLDTIPYEIYTSISERIKRVYYQE
jgi:alanine racemase